MSSIKRKKAVIIVSVIIIAVVGLLLFFRFGIPQDKTAVFGDYGVNSNGDPICLEYNGRLYAKLTGERFDRYRVNLQEPTPSIPIHFGDTKESISRHLKVSPFIGDDTLTFLWAHAGVDKTKRMVTFFDASIYYASDYVIPQPTVQTVNRIETIVYLKGAENEQPQPQEHTFTTPLEIERLLALSDEKGLAYWAQIAEKNGRWPTGLVKVTAFFDDTPLTYFIGAFEKEEFDTYLQNTDD